MKAISVYINGLRIKHDVIAQLTVEIICMNSPLSLLLEPLLMAKKASSDKQSFTSVFDV